MRGLSTLLNKREQPVSKARNRDDMLGEEMEKFFGVKLYWIPKKYGWQETYEAFRECQTRVKANKNYLLAILNRRKKEAILKAALPSPPK